MFGHNEARHMKYLTKMLDEEYSQDLNSSWMNSTAKIWIQDYHYDTMSKASIINKGRDAPLPQMTIYVYNVGKHFTGLVYIYKVYIVT